MHAAPARVVTVLVEACSSLADSMGQSQASQPSFIPVRPHHGPIIVTRLSFRRERCCYPYNPLYYGTDTLFAVVLGLIRSSYDSHDSSQQRLRADQISRQIDRPESKEVQQLREEQEYSAGARATRPSAGSSAPQQRRKRSRSDCPWSWCSSTSRSRKSRTTQSRMRCWWCSMAPADEVSAADIDLAATMKLNDERGVDFQIPNPVMSQ